MDNYTNNYKGRITSVDTLCFYINSYPSCVKLQGTSNTFTSCTFTLEKQALITASVFGSLLVQLLIHVILTHVRMVPSVNQR